MQKKMWIIVSFIIYYHKIYMPIIKKLKFIKTYTNKHRSCITSFAIERNVSKHENAIL